MKKISEERLKRVRHAVENNLSSDIVRDDGEYDVYHDNDYVGTYESLTEAIHAWDAAQLNPPQHAPRDEDVYSVLNRVEGVDLEQFSVGDDYNRVEQRGPWRETPDTGPTWDEYDFDEDGYKIRRKR